MLEFDAFVRTLSYFAVLYSLNVRVCCRFPATSNFGDPQNLVPGYGA
jgi:hypothetical protein